MRNRDTFRGCLIGGAAGDALGYAVEFMREGDIDRKYGEQGITAYDLTDGKALISDDTQMTLFTAAGLMRASALGTDSEEGGCGRSINDAYLDWLKTQLKHYPLPEGTGHSWLVNIPELFDRRAPGNTCMDALMAGGAGTPEEPVNHSKGCGGVMRAAPVGLYFNDRGKSIREICRIGAEAAALTHGHELGWIPAAALAQIIHEISQDGVQVRDAVMHTLDTADEMWPETGYRRNFRKLMEKAVALASEDLDDREAIHQLGEGWVAEETLAIAVYCAVRYSGDIDRTLIAAVNHKGDSDSTGAVAGNIIGAQVGLSGIPEKYTKDLELRDLIIEVADDLWQGGGMNDPVWTQKYTGMSRRRNG